MDIEQITYETFDRVDRLDRDLRKHMKKEKTGSGAGTTINTTEITSSIKGADDVNLTEVNTKIDGCGTTICEDIKGTDNVDLTKLSEKIDNLASYIAENPVTIQFSDDPFKLDEEFVGYTPGETTFNTTDYVECTKPYILNDEGRNPTFIIAFLAIYCEDDTFDAKVMLDIETTVSNAVLDISFPNTTIGTETKSKKQINLTEGRNLICELIENVNVSTNGNYICVRILNGNKATINSYKIEVEGKNIAILTKPQKFKVFCKYGETIISKLENNNAYTLQFKTDNLNPGTLKSPFSLAKENVRDFSEIFCTYKSGQSCTRCFNCRTYLTLDGQKYDEYGDILYKLSLFSMGEVCALIDNAHNLKFNFTVFIGNYNTDNLRLIYYSGSLENLYDSNFLIASNNNIANFTFIYDCENRNMNFNPISSILTYKNQVNYLFITLSSSSVKLDLGIGKNLTAYYDATNKNIIYVYMKVGDKMVKKTVQITTVTEDDTTTKTAEIIEQKVIGTYDYYFETPSEKYIVVKDDQLYVFK